MKGFSLGRIKGGQEADKRRRERPSGKNKAGLLGWQNAQTQHSLRACARVCMARARVRSVCACVCTFGVRRRWAGAGPDLLNVTLGAVPQLFSCPGSPLAPGAPACCQPSGVRPQHSPATTRWDVPRATSAQRGPKRNACFPPHTSSSRPPAKWPLCASVCLGLNPTRPGHPPLPQTTVLSTSRARQPGQQRTAAGHAPRSSG